MSFYPPGQKDIRMPFCPLYAGNMTQVCRFTQVLRAKWHVYVIMPCVSLCHFALLTGEFNQPHVTQAGLIAVITTICTNEGNEFLCKITYLQELLNLNYIHHSFEHNTPGLDAEAPKHEKLFAQSFVKHLEKTLCKHSST
jgi:hypothetical protein